MLRTGEGTVASGIAGKSHPIHSGTTQWGSGEAYSRRPQSWSCLAKARRRQQHFKLTSDRLQNPGRDLLDVTGNVRRCRPHTRDRRPARASARLPLVPIPNIHGRRPPVCRASPPSWRLALDPSEYPVAAHTPEPRRPLRSTASLCLGGTGQAAAVCLLAVGQAGIGASPRALRWNRCRRGRVRRWPVPLCLRNAPFPLLDRTWVATRPWRDGAGLPPLSRRSHC